MRVSQVSLQTAWRVGSQEASKSLKLLKINLGELPDNIDLLQPFGKDYVRLNDDFDLDAPALKVETLEQPSIHPSKPALPQAVSELPQADEDTCRVELDDLLPEVGDLDMDTACKHDKHWISVDGVDIHKSTAVRDFLATIDGRKSTDQLVRVQGVKKIRTFSCQLPPPQDDDNSIIGDQFLPGEFVAMFVHIKNTAALAILCISDIKSANGVAMESVAMCDISRPTNIIFISQVLTLVQEDATTWIWGGEYKLFNAINGGKVASATASRKSSLIELSTQVAPRVKPMLAPQLSDLMTHVWKFMSSMLSSLVEVMWTRIKDYEHLIPSRTATPMFPLHVPGSQEYIFMSHEGTAALENGPKQGCANCFFCNEEVIVKKMRNHVGAHILAKLLALLARKKDSLRVQVSNQCGVTALPQAH